MIIFAVAIGIAASFALTIGIATMCLMPAIVFCQHRRRDAYAVAFAYYAAASWAIMPAARNFFGPDPPVISVLLLWIASAALLALPWAAFWSGSKAWQSLWRIPVATCAAVVPPLGIIGWASPLCSAGLLFPGTGWLGLIATGTLPALVLRKQWPTIAAAILLANTVFTGPPTPPARWEAVNTDFGSMAHGEESPTTVFAAAEWIQRRALESTARVVVFPETVVPMWTEATELFWQPTLATLRASGKTIVVGAQTPEGNVAMVRGTDYGIFRQHVPVPIGMWNPFASGGFPVALGAPPSIDIAGQRSAVWICYEQLLTWPVLYSIAARPAVVIAMANDYWAVGTPIPHCQATMVRIWCRLFQLRYVQATNY